MSSASRLEQIFKFRLLITKGLQLYVLEMQLDWKVRLQLPSTCMDAYNKAELSGDKIFSFLPTSSFNITICQKVKALGIS